MDVVSPGRTYELDRPALVPRTLRFAALFLLVHLALVLYPFHPLITRHGLILVATAVQALLLAALVPRMEAWLRTRRDAAPTPKRTGPRPHRSCVAARCCASRCCTWRRTS